MERFYIAFTTNNNVVIPFKSRYRKGSKQNLEDAYRTMHRRGIHLEVTQIRLTDGNEYMLYK